MMPHPECPVCRVSMEEGHVLERGDGDVLKPLLWTEGAAEKGGIHGYRVKDRRQIEVAAFRCPRCGWMIWFAPERGD
jgi:hypothetical protein